MNNHVIHYPKGVLADSVLSIQYIEHDSTCTQFTRLLSDGSIYLNINLQDDPLRLINSETYHKNFWISGLLLKPLIIECPKFIRALIVRFKASGGYPIMGIPLCELSNSIIDADNIFGENISSLRDQMLNTKSIVDKIKITERWLYFRLIQNQPIVSSVVHYAINKISRCPSSIKMELLAERTGYSHQHLINIFRKYVGVSPKQYQKIARFNAALRFVGNIDSFNWSDLLYDLGYYDQSHFIKDFKTFSGVSPSEYVRKVGDYIHSIPA